MDIINKEMLELEKKLKDNNVPYLVKYFSYFDGSGGYRDFSIKDIIGESRIFEVERYENPISETYKVYFIPKEDKAEFEIKEIHDVIRQGYFKQKYRLTYDKNRGWFKEIIESYEEVD